MSAPDDRSSSPNVVVCSCCGRGLLDNARENVWHAEVPYPGDFGTGLCRSCGGDPDAREPRARLGWAVCVFVDARLPIVAASLNEENRKRFLESEYEDQVRAVLGLVAKGLIA